MGARTTMVMSDGAVVRESCRRLLQEWLSRDIKRLMQLTSPCREQADQTCGQDGQKTDHKIRTLC